LWHAVRCRVVAKLALPTRLADRGATLFPGLDPCAGFLPMGDPTFSVGATQFQD